MKLNAFQFAQLVLTSGPTVSAALLHRGSLMAQRWRTGDAIAAVEQFGAELAEDGLALRGRALRVQTDGGTFYFIAKKGHAA